jgi:hypothetical protein
MTLGPFAQWDLPCRIKKAGGRDTTGFFYATAGSELRCRRIGADCIVMVNEILTLSSAIGDGVSLRSGAFDDRPLTFEQPSDIHAVHQAEAGDLLVLELQDWLDLLVGETGGMRRSP